MKTIEKSLNADGGKRMIILNASAHTHHNGIMFEAHFVLMKIVANGQLQRLYDDNLKILDGVHEAYVYQSIPEFNILSETMHGDPKKCSDLLKKKMADLDNGCCFTITREVRE